MQNVVVWRGLEADTTETCTVTQMRDTIIVRSEIIGWYERQAVHAEYELRLDMQWNVTKFEVVAQIADKPQMRYSMQRMSELWYDDSGKEAAGFYGCNYIDISLTPLTNSLPINGLGLSNGESRDIDVIYIDIMGKEMRHDRQRYTRLGRLKYHFENDSGNFTADINVDENGFVTDYPGLFETI